MTFTPGPGTKFLPYTGTPATFGPLTITGGTVTANTPVVDATQTWNSSGTTFTGIKFDVTDTASAAGSLLMDLRVGGVSRINVSKGGVATSNGWYLLGGSDVGFSLQGADGINFVSNGTRMRMTSSGLFLGGTLLNIGGSLSSGNVVIATDGANALATRNGVNAQTFNIYNTFTDASNYERGFVRWSANVFEIGAEAAGTGTNRSVDIRAGGSSKLFISQAVSGEVFKFSIPNTAGGYLNIANTGNSKNGRIGQNVSSATGLPADKNINLWMSADDGGTVSAILKIGSGSSQPALDFWTVAGNVATKRLSISTGGTLSTEGGQINSGNVVSSGFFQATEIAAPAAPAADGVRIYAVDNGSGKTQLMALFATGAAQQIAIEP
jgi:hypothetical protein